MRKIGVIFQDFHQVLLGVLSKVVKRVYEPELNRSDWTHIPTLRPSYMTFLQG